MKRVNKGWIYIQRNPGMNDTFYVKSKDSKGLFMGYGIEGSEKAVDFFEKGLDLGAVKLEDYGPLGYRVYTEEGEVGDVYEVNIPGPSDFPDEVIAGLQALNKAVDHVVNLWDHTGTNMVEGYPKCLPSWEEFAADIDQWVTTQVELRRKS